MPNLCIIPARALQHPELTGTDIRVLCAIGLHTDRLGAGCWASSRTLAEEAGVDQRKFFRCAKKLLDAGLIARESGKLHGTSSTYAVILDEVITTIPGVVKITTPLVPKRPHLSGQKNHSPTINAPFNAPLNAPTTRRGGKLAAAQLLKAVRAERSIAYPTSLTAGWRGGFTETQQQVINAVGIERILTTEPKNDGPLLAQVAEMLGEVAA